MSKLRQVRNKFEAIKDELDLIRAFLGDAERQEEAHPSNSEDSLKAWVQKVSEVAFEVEDIMDEFSYLFNAHRGRRLRRCRALLRKAIRPMPWLNVSDQLQRVESRLRHLSEMKDRYSIRITHEDGTLQGDANRALERVAQEALLMQEDEVVGIESSKSTLTQWLVDDDEPAGLTNISVWGMGGLGKTTLVTQVYKSQAVREHFTVRAWVSVSQTYQAEDLLKSRC
uniref:Disease resistance protein RPP13 n=1 Tax=Anthurium amnicola TaxID=1678845 RepID=A0A1D1Z393_9ARAE